MTQEITLVARDRHDSKKWLRHKDYGFAAAMNVLPIAAAELSPAARAFPLGFISENGKTIPVMLLGLQAGQNYLVAPDGKWVGHYVPAALRGYPFRLGRTNANDNEFALLVDEASGLVNDLAVGEDGVPFFDTDGKPHSETQQVLEFLVKTRQSIEVAERGSAVLADKGVLEPWPLTLKDGVTEKRVEGVSRVNEVALSQLAADDLVTLRDAGALALAYAQLISMGNISLLSTLAQAHANARAQQAGRMRLPEGSFMPEEDGDLKLDWNTFLKDK